MTKNFRDYSAALAMRDLVERLAKNIVDRERPRYQYAVVSSIDRANRRATVVFTGDTNSVTVAMGSIQPSIEGQIVRVAGIGSDKFIEDVTGETYVDDPRFISIDATLTNVDTRLNTIEGDGWKEVGAPGNAAFASTWSNFGGQWATAAYRSENGYTHLKGLVETSVDLPVGNLGAHANRVIFTLPVGFRPDSDLHIVTTNAGNNHARINILTGGQVQCNWSTGDPPAVNGWWSLDVAPFRNT